jgi:hypothetical protein
MCATAEGVVSVFRYCSDMPCHTWSYSRRGVFVLVVRLAYRAEASEAGITVRSYPDRGNSGLGRLFRTLRTHESCI